MYRKDELNTKKLEPMLTTAEVSQLLNVHPSTLRRWSNKGVIKTYRIGSRADRRFRRDDVYSFLSLA